MTQAPEARSETRTAGLDREVLLLALVVVLGTNERAYGTMPTVAAVLRALPEPADHPIFHISASHPQGGSAPE